MNSNKVTTDKNTNTYTQSHEPHSHRTATHTHTNTQRKVHIIYISTDVYKHTQITKYKHSWMT